MEEKAGEERVGGVNRERKRGWGTAERGDKADAVSQPLASSCNPRGPRVQSFPGSECLSHLGPARLMDRPEAEAPSAGECSPGLCVPRCCSPRDALEKGGEERAAARGTRPGRAQSARRRGHPEGGQWREKGRAFGHPGDTVCGAKPAVEFLAGGRARQTRAPGVSPVPSRSTPDPRGSRSRTLPHAARSPAAARRGPAGRAQALRSQSPRPLDSKRAAPRSRGAAPAH